MGVKMPPIEKIHEAYSAIADGRITIKEEEAEVVSSDLSKIYVVRWKDGVYSSNDNASYWKGYAGYPIIAVLMLQKKLSLDKEIADYFKVSLDYLLCRETVFQYSSSFTIDEEEMMQLFRKAGQKYGRETQQSLINLVKNVLNIKQ